MPASKPAFTIGPHSFASNIALAPMAGVTDSAFRQLCRDQGAGWAASEMITSDSRLWHTDKTRHRLDHSGETGVRIVQIAGADPAMMADAARRQQALGADIVDINMGCPMKKVCKRLAGSALLSDEALVRAILEATVDAVDIPVTLKIRTGPCPETRNGVTIAHIAEKAGIAALAVHGRTRACRFKGAVEYDTIADIKRAVSIPVIANGDIDSVESARRVLRQTGADGLMIGRAAQGQPWIFRILNAAFGFGDGSVPASVPDNDELRGIMLAHLENLYALYGEYKGVRVARKHLSWYCERHRNADAYRALVVRAQSAREQLILTENYFDTLSDTVALAA